MSFPKGVGMLLGSLGVDPEQVQAMVNQFPMAVQNVMIRVANIESSQLRTEKMVADIHGKLFPPKIARLEEGNNGTE
jgi:D-mannonate dehydratase